MDEIDQVVDNLFSQYLKPGSAVTAGSPQAQVPQAEQPPAPPAVDQPPEDLVLEVNHSPSISVPEVPAAQPVAPQTSPAITAPAKKKAIKAAPVKKAVPKGKAKSVKGIKEIKAETAKMLRYLSMAIKAENWWHKLYYSNKFVRKSMYIAQIITKRKKT